MQNNIFFELIPLVAFFGVYYITKNIFLATGVCIIASWLQLILCKIKYRQVTKKLWLSTSLITLLGGLTIILHNKTFVMLKPTVLFWLIGTSMLTGQVVGKNSLEIMLYKEIQLPRKIWNHINAAWGIFFIFLGGLNLFIAFHFSEYMWVKFKVFGSTVLMLAFMLLNALYISLHLKKHKPKS
jgi:intracellular septation protein